jgi:hypothetical protein
MIVVVYVQYYVYAPLLYLTYEQTNDRTKQTNK